MSEKFSDDKPIFETVREAIVPRAIAAPYATWVVLPQLPALVVVDLIFWEASLCSHVMAMRFARWFLWAMAVLVIETACRDASAPEAVLAPLMLDRWVAPLGLAEEEPTDDSLRIYAVNIIRDPPQEWTGYGIYLGRGLVLTAEHVVGSASRTRPSVRIAGVVLPATAIREGSLESVDLTLLEVDERQLPVSLQLRRMPVCQMQPWVGQPVIVAIPEGTARSHIMSPRLLPARYRVRFSTVISDVATTGNSGSGVFDAASKCLLGIMSRKFMVRANGANPESEFKDLAKYFVPAATITTFIPSRYHF